jgi:pectate lyase
MKLAIFRRSHVSARRIMKSSGLLAAGLLAITSTSHAVPVIPGAAGYGIETPAGRGGSVYRVTNLNASGAGSLKACIDGTSARTCVFEVSGTIRLSSDLIIRNNKITIAGQTAPSPGILIRGASLRIQASDVLVQHLRVRPGDDTNGPDPSNRDALKIEGTSSKPVRNVIIDHCSFSWAIDETVSVWGPHDNITFSNNIFSEALHQSLHPNGAHGFGVILGPHSGSSITMVGNLFAHMVERNPLARTSELVFVNNVVYDRGTIDLDIQAQNAATVKSTVVHNLFIRGPSYSRDTSPIKIHTDGAMRVGTSSRIFQGGNKHINYGSQMLSTTGSVYSGLIMTSSYPVWNSNMSPQHNSNDEVYNRVLAYAGARPKDRDSVDKRIVAQVKARSGRIINCVADNGTSRCRNRHAGSYPWISQNRRTLSLPSSQNKLASNGYTNLENWLHSLDQQIAGTVSTTSPISPSSLSVQ